MPRPGEVHVAWGNAVDVGPPNASPTDAEVEAVFARYVAELRRVFDKHKDRCLPPRVAARGLEVVRRGARSRRKFTKVLSSVALHSNYTRALTYENGSQEFSKGLSTVGLHSNYPRTLTFEEKKNGCGPF